MKQVPNHPVIVIGREFGSGGRIIGMSLARRLGYKYYDWELLKETAINAGLTQEALFSTDEHRPSFLSSFQEMILGACSGNYTSGETWHDRLYNITSSTIKLCAERGPCVILGRTADHILRDNPRMRSVFLHAPLEYRARRIVERGDCRTLEEAREMAKTRDRLRSKYYNYYTSRRWGQADNYHMSLDASLLSVDGIVDVISSLLCFCDA